MRFRREPGRQIFAVGDVGQNKASVLVTRLNSYFGTDWECCAGRITASEGWPESLDWFAGYCNIVVTCVDTGKAREEIAGVVKNLVSSCDEREAKPLPFIGTRETRGPSYWLDFGNSRTTGQIVLGRFSQYGNRNHSLRQLTFWLRFWTSIPNSRSRQCGRYAVLLDA